MSWLAELADLDCCDITTIGRRSGNSHEIEIWFGVIGDVMYIISGNGPSADWYRNALANPEVSVRLAGQLHQGLARPVVEVDERRAVGDLMGVKYPWDGDPSIGLTFEAWCYDVPVLAIESWLDPGVVTSSVEAVSTGVDEPRTRHTALAVAVLFFVNGMTFSNWLPRIPEVRDSLGLGNAGLGAALLGGGLGGIVGALMVGRVFERLGSRRLLVVAASMLSIGLPLIGFAPTAVVLLLVLTGLGMLDVFNDVAMNAQGVIVQQRVGRSIMNRLHAMWSLGFTAGAILGSAAAAAGVGVRTHLIIVGAVLLMTVAVVRPYLIAIDPAPTPEAAGEPGRKGRPRLSSAVVAMAFAAFAAAALEVTPNDWAAVLMRDVFDTGQLSGFGTVACAGAMLVGRLGGDHVLDRIGERRLLVLALAITGAGTVITITAPVAAVAFVGLAVWGLGLSVVFPQLYATAARLPGTSAGAGMGSMLFGQRLGGMITAVSVGALAEWYDLRVAFAVVAVVAFSILAVALSRTWQ